METITNVVLVIMNLSHQAYKTYYCIQNLLLHTILIATYKTYYCIQFLLLHTKLIIAYNTAE